MKTENDRHDIVIESGRAATASSNRASQTEKPSHDRDRHGSAMELDAQTVSTISLPRDEMLNPAQYHRQSREKSTVQLLGHIDTSGETLLPLQEVIDPSSSGYFRVIGPRDTGELSRGNASTDVPEGFDPQKANTTRLNTVEKTAPQPFLQTGLGELPPEIREMISKIVFDAPRDIELGFIPAVAQPKTSEVIDCKVSTTASSTIGLSLLRTCRQIY